jgi:xanthine/CO dehydrogenase XdhC/CoxF family maturation factor
MLIIGAGQLSRFLAQIAVGLEYQVTVCDPREEYRASWSLPGVEVVHAMPDDVVLEMKLDSRSAVIALTHDPKLDDLALMEALKTDAFYVGAIGSRLNNARRRERLREFDLSEAQIARCTARSASTSAARRRTRSPSRSWPNDGREKRRADGDAGAARRGAGRPSVQRR